MDSEDTDASVLLNAHFDSPLGSPGAGDCGSCVGGLINNCTTGYYSWSYSTC